MSSTCILKRRIEPQISQRDADILDKNHPASSISESTQMRFKNESADLSCPQLLNLGLSNLCFHFTASSGSRAKAATGAIYSPTDALLTKQV